MATEITYRTPLEKALAYLNRLRADSLLSNSFYLMLSTLIMACVGFFFWIIAARLYTPEQIGLTTTFISVTSLIANLSLLGMNTTLVRFLPESQRRREKINTAFTVVACAAAIFGVIYLSGVRWFTPTLGFLRDSFPVPILLVGFFSVAAMNALSDNVFMAFRNARYILFIYSAMSAIRIFMPFLLVSLGLMGLVSAYIIPVIVAAFLSLAVIRLKYQHTFRAEVNRTVLRNVFRYSIGNYMGNIISSLPIYILPILVTNTLGPRQTAYFYMPSMILTLLNTIPRSMTQSLFVEGSHSQNDLKRNVVKTLRATLTLFVPSVLAVIILGQYVLHVFGAGYSEEGLLYLQLIAIASVFGIMGYITGAILNIKKLVRKTIYLNIVNTVLTLSLVVPFLRYGLAGLGIAGIITQVIMALVDAAIIIRILKGDKTDA